MSPAPVATALHRLQLLGDPRPATVVERTRAHLTGVVPTAEDRQTALRTLAQEAEDFEPDLLRVLVGALSDDDLTREERRDAWCNLVDSVELLTSLGTGDVTPREIAPGAPAHSAWTVAADVLEQDIASALVRLVVVEDERGENACPECPTGIVESVGRMEWETGHQPYACNAGCGFYG